MDGGDFLFLIRSIFAECLIITPIVKSQNTICYSLSVDK